MRNRQKDNVAWSSRAMDEAVETGSAESPNYKQDDHDIIVIVIIINSCSTCYVRHGSKPLKIQLLKKLFTAVL